MKFLEKSTGSFGWTNQVHKKISPQKKDKKKTTNLSWTNQEHSFPAYFRHFSLKKTKKSKTTPKNEKVPGNMKARKFAGNILRIQSTRSNTYILLIRYILCKYYYPESRIQNSLIRTVGGTMNVLFSQQPSSDGRDATLLSLTEDTPS